MTKGARNRAFFLVWKVFLKKIKKVLDFSQMWVYTYIIKHERRKQHEAS
jgi:hypothetical protein